MGRAQGDAKRNVEGNHCQLLALDGLLQVTG